MCDKFSVLIPVLRLHPQQIVLDEEIMGSVGSWEREFELFGLRFTSARAYQRATDASW